MIITQQRMRFSVRPIVTVTFIVITLFTSAVKAQTEPGAQVPASCPAGIPQTAGEEAFLLRPNGEVLHIASNLIFMRCSLGQTWNGNTCLNEPRAYNWQEALQASVSDTTNGLMSWRLPNVKELSVISERGCVRPSINDTIFPNTSPDDYWTSSPSAIDESAAWSVAFNNASITQRLKTRSMFVRLVRTKVAADN